MKLQTFFFKCQGLRAKWLIRGLVKCDTIEKIRRLRKVNEV